MITAHFKKVKDARHDPPKDPDGKLQAVLDPTVSGRLASYVPTARPMAIRQAIAGGYQLKPKSVANSSAIQPASTSAENLKKRTRE
ncbi:hypothetical protein HDU83_008926 [Entophlyctis luteolus]|nr:hypothetical protein HDU82_008630 [Entophlyctis luteolus]KAJ3351424.1 hypothetical protein HDU83_008926 [Entophlyctis luteolus]KAJ3390926.1 hypothetical protein HDU84_006770 [Entophlyctis sp. JEL0112]